MKLTKKSQFKRLLTGFLSLFMFAGIAFALDDTVEIQAVNHDKKQVSMVVTDIGRSNPFVPVFGGFDEDTNVYLESPPEVPEIDNDALDVIKTRVTGIIYDKNNVKSSAIFNVGGTDYLTRVGDTINGYIVKAIDKNDITVQLGVNVFKAAVGDVIEENENLYDVNKTQTPDLENKFAGRRK